MSDTEIKELIRSKLTYDLFIVDGAYPECSLALANHFKTPYMFINTVGFHTASLSLAGNPTPYSVTPFFSQPLTDNMNLFQRILNTFFHISMNVMHQYTITFKIDDILKRHLGPSVPPTYELTKNVSFILQNAHATVTYPRPYLPNVAEIACIHCKPAKPLPKVR